jgi:cupin 2 domain-containing protein
VLFVRSIVPALPGYLQLLVASPSVAELTNLYEHVDSGSQAERFEPLFVNAAVRVERIVSHGHASPPGFWYDQPHGEWVTVLAGEARLRFEDETQARHLRAGDFIDITPHRRHRVEWTHPDTTTIWLAVHYGGC